MPFSLLARQGFLPESTPMRLQQLSDLLETRLEIIADQALRKDAQAHLAALKRISEAIQAEREAQSEALPPRLKHFLDQASFDKALDFLKNASSTQS